MALTHSVLSPLTAAIGRAHGRFGVMPANVRPQFVPSRRYPQPIAARVIGTSGSAALSRSYAGVNPYVTYQSLYTGRFAGRHYPEPRLGTVQWRGRWAGPRLGQNVFTDLFHAGVNAAENIAGGLPINAPNAGGGSVTIAQPFVAQHDFMLPDGTQVFAGQTVTPAMANAYVNAQGQDQSTPDPTAGQTPTDQLKQAAADAGPGGLLVAAGIAALGLFFLFKK
jgi:hypothetical protein